MRSSFKIKPLISAVAVLSACSLASAAGLERSGQDMTSFLQDGTYAEASYAFINADVTGRDASGNKVKDIAEPYDFFNFGVKTDINDTFSIGVIYDEPWGAAADYHGNNDFVGSPIKVVNGLIASRLGAQGITDVAGFKGYVADTGQKIEAGRQQLAQAEAALQANPGLASELTPQIEAGKAQLAAGEAQYQKLKGLEGVLDTTLSNTSPTKVEVRSDNITGLLGMKFGENNNFQVYGGPVLQRLKAKVALRGDAYETATNYDLKINRDTDYGWIAGISYSKPEIALKAALTYRSEIKHHVDTGENLPLAALLGNDPHYTGKMQVKTPESVNFNFQTGINPTTLATAKVRWVPWGNFKITPPLYNTASKVNYGPKGLNLVDYDDDQWLVELGLAKRVAPNLAISGTVGWDSGAGDPVTSLGPIEGYYSVGLGAKYNFDENWAISAGGKYLMFGDAKGKIPNGNIVSRFKNNDGYIVGVKLSYQDK
ncbi:OmpP1/FadL family transporter [Psychrobacter lutiphocae]|uniref:OmpP1/FadL family transporter n=1 Tax=Psychrobacter lutiphocae TaxID=540500 RepID=UPI000375EB1E|nr:outer membrane protein transport protein [Psychrobacter lutiphocae]